MKIHAVRRTAAIAWLCAGAWLAGSGTAVAQETYLQGGTQGVGVGFGLGLSSWTGLRADVNGFNLSHGITAGGNHYDGELRVRQGGAYFDVFPLRTSGFRLTGGLIVDHDRLNGTADPTVGPYTFNGVANPTAGYYTLNGTRYPAFPGQTISASLRYPAVMPYFGIGYGHQPTAHKGFGFIADLGVAYGRPSVDFNVAPVYVDLAGAQNVSAEEQSIRDSVEKYRFYPIIQIGVSYRF